VRAVRGSRARAAAIAALAGAAIALLFAAPASGRDRVISVATPRAPGPAELNRVTVHQFGPAAGKRVLVLMPGTIGGAGDFTLVARDLVRRVDGLQVWAIDRRSNALEDTATFMRAERGEISLQQMFDYYLGWITNGGNPADHFGFLPADAAPYARGRW
jgi:hypothetical protein